MQRRLLPLLQQGQPASEPHVPGQQEGGLWQCDHRALCPWVSILVLILVILVFHCSQGVWGHPWHWSGGGCYSYLGWGEILQKQHDLHLSFWWMSNFIHWMFIRKDRLMMADYCRKSIYWWNPQTRDQQHLRTPDLGRCDSDLDLQHCPAPASVYP